MALIICGHQRSGTTLLQKICNSHPEITITMEFGNFLELNCSYKAYCIFMLKWWWNIKNAWGINPAYSYMKFGILANFIFISKYLLRLFPFYSQKIGIQSNLNAFHSIFPKSLIVGDKWPDYIFLLDKLVDLKPLKFLVIYRDCRDVTSSTLKMARTKWKKQPWVNILNSAEKIATRWVQAIENMEKHRGRIYIIRYEDFIAKPQIELENLGRWLGVDPTGFPSHEIKQTSMGKFSQGLSKEELSTVLKIAGPTMERLGYF